MSGDAPVRFVPFRCFDCGEPVRGDGSVCLHCATPLFPTAFTKGEQVSEDRVTAGLCECCERPFAVCEADPCIEGMEPA